MFKLLCFCVVLVMIALLYKRRENFNDIAPIFKEKGKSLWDYYGNYNNYLMDKLTGGQTVDYLNSQAPYCDLPARNRSYLVNPLLTQKHIFIKPNIDEFSKDVIPDFGNSAEGIRIGAYQELLVPQMDYAYSNFSKVVKNNKPYQKDVIARCGVSPNEIPANTFTNPY